MLKAALIYGAISGTIIITTMIVGMSFADDNGYSGGQIFGYAIMLVALTLVFIGVKRYRDQELGGVIKFGPAFGLGLAIATVASFFYITGWEIHLAMTDYAFMDEYSKGLIAAKEKAGVTGAELQAYIAEVNKTMKQYGNPLFRLPMTFLEIFPVGLVVALASAGLLRNPKFLPAR